LNLVGVRKPIGRSVGGKLEMVVSTRAKELSIGRMYPFVE
jgi:hypothetical protein